MADSFSAQSSPRGNLIVAACRSGTHLAQKLITAYEQYQRQYALSPREQLTYLENLDEQFSDSETIVRLGSDVSGGDVFLVQALYDPLSERTVDENYMAFFIAARACREWGANHVTAILPYLAYARQDKPAPSQREPTTAKLTADLAIAAGIDRLITWHPHVQQIHGFYGGTPVHRLDSLTLFVEHFKQFAGHSNVLAVAPDVGATKFVTYFGEALNLTCAITSKYRPRPEEAVVAQLMGDTTHKHTALVVDDMISSGGTIEALVKKLVTEEDIKSVHVAASHNLCLPVALERLIELHEEYRVEQVVVTNSIPQTPEFTALPFFQVKDISQSLAKFIFHIHHNQPISELTKPPIMLR